MAKGDFKPRDGHRYQARPYPTKAGGTPIKVGEPVIIDTANSTATSKYVKAAPTNADSTLTWAGFASSNDTVTAANDGIIYVYDGADQEFYGRPKLASQLTGNISGQQCTIDLTNGVYTLNVGTTTNGVMTITNYNPGAGDVSFKIRRASHTNA